MGSQEELLLSALQQIAERLDRSTEESLKEDVANAAELARKTIAEWGRLEDQLKGFPP